MRAEQIMMIGVVGLGLYAVYRLTKASPQFEPDNHGPVLERRPLPPLPGPLPLPPAGVMVYSGNPIQLRAGGWYKGRIETAGGVPASTPRDIEQALLLLGLERVEVFMTPEEASPVIQQPFALANPGQGTRWFRARLPAFYQSGEAVPNTIARPAWLSLLWLSSAPSAPRKLGIGPPAAISGHYFYRV